MNEKKFAWGIGVAGCLFIALLVYLTAPDLTSSAPVVLLPANGAAAGADPRPEPIAQTPAIASARKSNADCSTARLNSWRLISLQAGAYRQGGFAVLNNDRRGTLTVAELQKFDGDLLLAKIAGNTVEIRCEQTVQTKVLADGRGAAAADSVSTPAMRTALPDPANH